MRTRIQVGRLLAEAGVLTQSEVAEVCAQQRREGGRFCTTALRAGLAEERRLVRALSRQLGVPGMVVSEVTPDPEGLELVPREAAERRVILPARVFQRTLTLLMRDPTDQQALNDLQFFSGKVIRPLVALEGPLRAAVARCYGGEEATVGMAVTMDLTTVTSVLLPEITAVPVAPLPPEQLLPVSDTPVEASIEADPELLAEINLVGGSLSVSSDDAQGEDSYASAERSGEVDDPRPVILAVDDEEAILKLYAGMLDPEAYRLVSCARGDEALDAVRRHQPRLVLLDALLPGMHGFEICRRIKEHESLRSTAVILLSAAYRGWQMRTDLMRQYGADEFIEKPFDIGYVLESIDRLLARGREPRARPLFADALEQLNAGLVKLQQGDLDAAGKAFGRSIEADPFAARPHFYLGKIHERRDAGFEAMYEYEQAVALDATFFPAIKDLAILYQSKGFVNKAVEMWQQALAVCPEATMRTAIREHLVRLL